MKITKLGHCCMLIEEKGLRILTDPGSYTIEQQKNAENIDIVLITHEHGDHLHIGSLKIIIVNSPKARIFTNESVGKILEKEKIVFELLLDGRSKEINGIIIEGLGEKHAEMYRDLTCVSNTGYFIAGRFFYPGDALTVPRKKVEVLALPVAGPWLKLSEAIDYAIAVKPKKCFPVHDGILKSIGSTDKIPAKVLPPLGIEFTVLESGRGVQF